MEYLIFNKPKTNIQRAFGLFAQLEKIENAVEKLKTVLEKESPKKAKKEKKEDEE